MNNENVRKEVLLAIENHNEYFSECAMRIAGMVGDTDTGRLMLMKDRRLLDAMLRGIVADFTGPLVGAMGEFIEQNADNILAGMDITEMPIPEMGDLNDTFVKISVDYAVAFLGKDGARKLLDQPSQHEAKAAPTLKFDLDVDAIVRKAMRNASETSRHDVVEVKSNVVTVKASTGTLVVGTSDAQVANIKKMLPICGARDFTDEELASIAAIKGLQTKPFLSLVTEHGLAYAIAQAQAEVRNLIVKPAA